MIPLVITALMAATPPGKLGFDESLNAGWQAVQTGKFDRAASHYTRALHLVPDSEDAWLGLQLAHIAAGRWTEALEAGERALELNPRSYWGLSRQAWAHYNKGQYSEAEAHYEAALKVNPDDGEMALGLGLARLAQQDFGGAADACAVAGRGDVHPPMGSSRVTA